MSCDNALSSGRGRRCCVLAKPYLRLFKYGTGILWVSVDSAGLADAVLICARDGRLRSGEGSGPSCGDT